MNLLAPWMLWGAAAGAIPVLVHLLFRSRFRTVAFPALELLLRAEEESRQRMRVLEALLMASRIGLIVMLAAALARPSSVGSGGGPIDAVVILDTSIGMDARDGTHSHWQRAQSAARSLVDSLPSNSTVQLIAVSDRVDAVGPRRPSDLIAAKALIDNLTLTVRGSDLAAAMPTALEAMRRSANDDKQLTVISHFAASGWRKNHAALAEAAREAKTLGEVRFVRVGGRAPRTAAIVGLSPHTSVPRIGERVGFAVQVKNRGATPLRHLTVSLTPDGDTARREVLPIERLEPGETQAVTLSARWSQPGLWRVTGRVASDELPADDIAERIVSVRDKVRVLVVDGSPLRSAQERGESFFLLHALLPVRDSEKEGYHIQPHLVSARQATPAMLADYDLCVTVNCAMPGDGGESLSSEFVEALARFVRGGRSLLLFLGDRVRPASFNGVLGARCALLPARLGDARTTDIAVDRVSACGPAFQKFRDDDRYRGFASAQTLRRFDLVEPLPAETRPLLRFTDGVPAVVMGSVGEGTVALVNTSADLSWTEMPLQVNVFVPLVDALMIELLTGGDGRFNVPANVGLECLIRAEDAERSFSLVRPDGSRLRLGPPASFAGRHRVVASETPVAGLYRIVPSDAPDSTGVPFAVSPVLDELGGTDPPDDSELDHQLGFSPEHFSLDDGDTLQAMTSGRTDWTALLLGVLAIWAVIESALSWLCDRKCDA